mmetsp:Transcript_46958/g.114561  ORF Transcript_46958/g.114561 Transcript_46958/m.114561 type:complete len:517 (+) Transcript_46958:110-1660(+)
MEKEETQPDNSNKKKKTTTPKKTVNVILMIFVFTLTWSVIIYHRILFLRHDGDGHTRDLIRPNTAIPVADISQSEHVQQIFPGLNGTSATNTSLPPKQQQQQQQQQQHQQIQDDTTRGVSNNLRRHPNFHFDFPLCLVHIGKTAGSSISCGLGFQYADCEGMPRQELPHTYYFHMRKNNCLQQQQPQQKQRPRQQRQRQAERPTSPVATFLFTVRNPLRRIQSWFEFEKNIVPTRRNKKIEQQIRKRRGILFVDCYKTFQGFVNHGLQIAAPSPSEDIQQQQQQQEKSLSKWNVQASTLWNMTCPERAWAAVLGIRDFSYHEYYNYDYYYNSVLKQIEQELLSPTAQQKENHSSTSFLVLRTEHLAEDWLHLSTEKLFRQVNRRGTRGNVVDVGDTAADATIAVGNTSTSETPAATVDNHEPQRSTKDENINWANLCHALCDEIQVYKKILCNAHNLNRTQIDHSINEVREMCPDETIEVRQCEESTRPKFPSMKVTRQQFRSEPDSKKKFFEVIG